MKKREFRSPRFAAVDNRAIDTLPSLMSVGLLTRYIRARSGETVTLASLRKQYREGESALSRAQKELVEAGLLVRFRVQSTAGLWSTDFTVDSVPFTADEVADMVAQLEEDPSVRSFRVEAAGALVPAPGNPGLGSDQGDHAKPQVAPEHGKPGSGNPGRNKDQDSPQKTEDQKTGGGLPSAVGARSVTRAEALEEAGDAATTPGIGPVREDPSDPRGSEPSVDDLAARRGRPGGPLRGEGKTSSSAQGLITATAPALQALAPVWSLLEQMSRPQRVMALKAADVLVGPCRRDAAELAAELERRFVPMSGADEHGKAFIRDGFGWLRAELGRLDMTACARCSATAHGSPFRRPLCAKCQTIKASQEARKGWTAADFERDAAEAERACLELARRLEDHFQEKDLAEAWDEAHGTLAGHKELGGAATPSLFDDVA